MCNYENVFKREEHTSSFAPHFPTDWNANLITGTKVAILDHEMKAMSCIPDVLEP